MSVFKLAIILIINSALFSYSIDYKINNSKLNLIDKHFIIDGSNAVVSNDNFLFDIHRLEFISDNNENIKFEIKNIEWVKTDYKLNKIDFKNLVSIGDVFHYRSCPTVYVDVLPYKVDSDNNLFYAKSIEIIFDFSKETIVAQSCIIDTKAINKDFLKQSNTINAQLNNSDYIIITNSLLKPAAESLKLIHQNDFDVQIVDIDDILFDNTENLSIEYIVRDYLLSEINTNFNLNYLLLLGDETIIPPIYLGSHPSDDFYTSPNDGCDDVDDINCLTAKPQLSTGRIPVSNIEDANNFIDKLDNYINNLSSSSIDFDYSWKSNIYLISDDENYSGSDQDFGHTTNSHILYEKIKTNLIPYTFYGVDYEPIQNSDGLLHTDLTNDLISNINRGVSLINYIGHGNHHTLADEKFLNLDRDLNLINPTNHKLPIWIVGTCSFAEYDGKDSMTEALIVKNDGAISVISTTRPIGSISNINYLKKIFNQINNYIEISSNKNRLGDLIRISKDESTSEHLFHLFGDPALPLPFPKINNDLILNNESLELIIGDKTNINIGPYNGYIHVFDEEKNIIRIKESGDSISYTIPGESIYKGYFNEEACFTTSIDASACVNCASIYTYMEHSGYNMQNHENNFIQNIFNLDINSQNNSSEDDLYGPLITFNTSDYRVLNDNNIIFLDDFIIVQAEDISGINLMSSIGHNIRYWFNNEENYSFVDQDSFEYIANCTDTPKGQFTIPVSNLELGINTLFVEIWDNFNNRTLSSIKLFIEDSSLKAYDVYNFPNPFSDNTSFTFKCSNYPTNATISIFDLNGLKIKELNKICENSFCSINWDGTCFKKQKIDNGTYIYSLKIEYDNQIFNDLYKVTKLK